MTTGTVQVKICGITTPDQAEKIAGMGADAIGLIFFPKSPRHVSDSAAYEITKVLPAHVARVGVFVNQSVPEIIETATHSNLSTVQLHGQYDPNDIRSIQDHGLAVVPLVQTGNPAFLSIQTKPPAYGVLVECGKGVLPGGNGATWNWGDASPLASRIPFAIAGGLAATNIKEAILSATPDAVDVSSGVESAPGIKDLKRVQAFITAARAVSLNREIRKVFK